MNEGDQKLLKKITRFLTTIGLEVKEHPITGTTFLPGLKIVAGRLWVDTEQLRHVGDVLHEAGHIALEPPAVRPTLDGDITTGNAGTEMAIHLWCFLACEHLKIAPQVVFHPEGYKGDAAWLVHQFSQQNYIGRPLLAWMNVVPAAGAIEILNWTRIDD